MIGAPTISPDTVDDITFVLNIPPDLMKQRLERVLALYGLETDALLLAATARIRQDRRRIRKAFRAGLADFSNRRREEVAHHFATHHPIPGGVGGVVMDGILHAHLQGIGLALPDCALLASMPVETKFMDETGAEAFLLQMHGTHDKRSLITGVLHLGPDLTWTSGMLEGNAVYHVPETVRRAVVGRPLVDLLRHPLLDRFPLKIDEWDDVLMVSGYDRIEILQSEIVHADV